MKPKKQKAIKNIDNVDERWGGLPTEPEQLSTDAYCGMSFARLGPETIISRSNDGKVLSRLKDDEWILLNFAYSVVDNPNFNFLPLYRKCDFSFENALLCKKIFVMRMFTPSYGRAKPLRIGTMHASRYLIIKMAQYCGDNNLKITEIFSSVEKFRAFQKTLPKLMSRTLIALVRNLNTLTDQDRGFSIDGQILPYLRKISRDFKLDGQQFPIIPSRILLFKYQQYNSYLDDFIEYYPEIRALLSRAAENPFYGKGKDSHFNPNSRGFKASPEQLAAHRQSPISFADAVQENSLGALASKYNWGRITNILSFVSEVSHCAKNLVHLYTLMRDHEVKSISTNCLTPVHGWNNDALYIAGITTKLYGVKKPRKWITTDAILKPIDVLEEIYKILSPYVHNPEKYLLISVASHPASGVKPAKDSLIKGESIESRLPEILITEADIQELEAVDPLRDWRGDPRFQVGKPWRISSHQFRRTMTVFCAQTGLITLPSLKRLLGHLTRVMSLYYAKGCEAQNFNFSLINPGLAKELSEAKAEADGAMFIREALQTTEKLYGIKGSTIMEERSNPAWFDRALNETLKLVKQGLAAYTETPLGGCASPVRCDKRAHGNFFSCPGCRHLVAKESVLNDTLNLMEFDLAELDPKSMEYRVEKQNLADFIELRERIIAKST